MSMLTGKGMYIWQVRKCDGGDTGRIVSRAQQAGLTHVLIKIADGRLAYNGDLTELVTALREADVEVWAWQYTYGSHPAEEAQFAADRFSEQPYAGFVVDADMEYTGHPDRARDHMDALRRELPDATIALSSYYLPDLRPTFPWREFLEHCDLNMPKVYWYNRSPEHALQQCLQQNAKFGRPIFPTGAAYEGACTPGEIPVFLEAARAHGLAGANFWGWQHATNDMWKKISGYAWRQPRLVVAVVAGTDFAYHNLQSRFHEDKFWVRPADLAPLVGLESAGETWLPLREVAADFELRIEYATEHLAAPKDPILYAFVHEPLPTGTPKPRVVLAQPTDGETVSGVVPVAGRVGNLAHLTDAAVVMVDVRSPDGLWIRKGRATWSESHNQDFILPAGWDTSGTPEGPNGVRAILYDREDGQQLAEHAVDVTVVKAGETLAQVSRGAQTKPFITKSYSWKSGVGRRHLHKVNGLCRAYAAECLAEYYLRTGQPNKRHSQRVFQYANVSVVGDDAHEWAAALRRGVDAHLGTWVDKGGVYPDGLQPGDMVFWMNGVNGYRGRYGHVAIVVAVTGSKVTISENSSSRGIGTHNITRAALAKMAGVMRWHR